MRSKKNPAPRPLTVVDLFCGAGGLSLGLRSSGWQVVRSIDHFGAAVATYRRNLGDHVVEEAIHEGTELPPMTMIVGGPPCQGFSSAGLRRTGDRRNTLVSVFAQLVVKHRPAMFMFENVEGFLTAEGGDRVLELLAPLVAAGYRVHLRKVNAANYGAPQHRKRVLAIGGLGWSPVFPEPTHHAYGAPGAELIASDRPAAPTIMDALLGLGKPSSDVPGSPQGHWCSPLKKEDLKRVRHLLPGQTMRDLPESYWHESYKRRAFRRVMDGTPSDRRGGAPCGVRRLKPDEPSKAITGGARSEFVHPTEDRYLSIRECARIQTFPDDFEFVGTVADQSLLIGNAIPPVLADAIGRSLASQIATASVDGGPGALLSFVPTTSSGMSPALRRITDAVATQFAGP
jgi:DNA (cytosine-5)-methyltransferase 1